MDQTFWQSIVDNECVVPAGYSVAPLTPELLLYLGFPDSEVREGPGKRKAVILLR